MTIDALQDLRAAAQAGLAAVSEAFAEWRTKAKARATIIEKLPGAALDGSDTEWDFGKSRATCGLPFLSIRS